MTAVVPKPPAGLASAGKRLWTSVLTAWDLEEHERALLLEAARTVDVLDRLAEIVARDGDMVATSQGPRMHPAVVEARQLRIAFARQVAALRLPDGESGDESLGRRQRRSGVRGMYKLRSVPS